MLAFADGWFTSFHVEIESPPIANTKIKLTPNFARSSTNWYLSDAPFRNRGIKFFFQPTPSSIWRAFQVLRLNCCTSTIQCRFRNAPFRICKIIRSETSFSLRIRGGWWTCKQIFFCRFFSEEDYLMRPGSFHHFGSWQTRPNHSHPRWTFEIGGGWNFRP